MLAPQDRQYYLDYSGCGNTVNANHPIVEKLIIDCLHYWVEELHVDGFRFDEASILHRGSDGSTMAWPPAVWRIELSERLANTKIIAEAWDAGGLYEIGSFPGERWSEWNGRFRDDVRKFVRGDPGVVAKLASRIAGSADIYEEAARFPTNSINFVTAHDGFTLNDLVSYNEKHNEANGEGNRDGIDENLSWNCGAEGETGNRHVQKLRRQQVKNFCAILMLSQGVPMFVAGDEVRRTQGGNNNAYCQDNELTWFDWGLVDENADTLRFFQRMIAFRKEHRALQRRNFFTGEVGPRGLPDVAWHGQDLGPPAWSDPDGRVLAFTIAGIESDPDIHVMMNMDDQERAFGLPSIEDRSWRVFADTSLPSPRDIAEPGRERALRGDTYPVEGRSIVILVSADRRRSRRTSS
jgi:glycogen operon protein